MSAVRISAPPAADAPAVAPGVDRVLQAFRAADIPVELLPDWQLGGAQEGPLLLLYPAPDLALAPELLQAPGGLGGHYHRLLEALSTWEPATDGRHRRLVNLGLSALPGLITWSVERLEGLEEPGVAVERDPWFTPRPEPLSALITLELLRRDTAILPAYLALECHPLAAAAEGRTPDRDYPERLQAAAGQTLLLQQHQVIAQATADLRLLGHQLGAARAELIDAAWIREQLSEQLQQMQAALAELEAFKTEAEQLQVQLQGQLEAERTEATANHQMIQATLEQAVEVSRHQDTMHDLAGEVITALQRQLSRLAAG